MTDAKPKISLGTVRYYGANATRHLSCPTPFLRHHAELAGNLLANKREAIRLRTAMMQVEAVVKMLQPGFNVASIAAKRCNKSNPWFKRGTMFRSAVDALRRAEAPMTARGIAEAIIADKAVPATRKQFVDLQAAIVHALRKRDGAVVVGEGAPAR